jgi:hypothetical protein
VAGDRLDPALVRAELVARRERAEWPFDNAVWCLLTGEPDEGLEILRRHVAETRAEGAGNRHRVELAVVAGDWDTAKRDATAAATASLERYVPGYREYAAAMLHLIAGDDLAAQRNTEELERVVGGREKLRGGQPALVTEIPGGLLERDADRVAAGLDALLGWHLRRARARSEIFNSARGAICLDAIVALLIAHRRGLPVRVDTRYRAASVPLLVLYLVEWQGDPLPRGLKLSVETDLLAGAWLRTQGLDLGEPPVGARTKPRGKPRVRRRAVDAGEDFVRQSLRMLVRDGRGSTWQLASWSLLIGDPAGGRLHLRHAAAVAQREWRESAPPENRGLRRLWRVQALPNQNFVREHFALALVLGDDDALAETSELLATWHDAMEDDMRRRGLPPRAEGRYGHAAGYLDLLSALLGRRTPELSRTDAERIMGPRVACVGLVERDARLVSMGLEEMLDAHARVLERTTSPPPAVHEPAVHVAVTARRLGIPVQVDERFASHLVPIEIRNLAGHEGRVGRLPCDLLGRPLWET